MGKVLHCVDWKAGWRGWAAGRRTNTCEIWLTPERPMSRLYSQYAARFSASGDSNFVWWSTRCAVHARCHGNNLISKRNGRSFGRRTDRCNPRIGFSPFTACLQPGHRRPEIYLFVAEDCRREVYYDKIAEMRNGTVREVVQTPHAMIATVVTVLLSPNASLYVARYTGRLYMYWYCRQSAADWDHFSTERKQTEATWKTRQQVHSLPTELRQSDSLEQFKRQLKTHLFGLWDHTPQR